MIYLVWVSGFADVGGFVVWIGELLDYSLDVCCLSGVLLHWYTWLGGLWPFYYDLILVGCLDLDLVG